MDMCGQNAFVQGNSCVEMTDAVKLAKRKKSKILLS